MTERRLDTELWSHPDFQGLSTGAKLLYLYSWSNNHCNAAGLYRISLETIAFETRLPLAEIPTYLEELGPLDVEWQNGQKTLWVKKFLKHQGRSPKFLVAVAHALDQISDQDLVKTYLQYNNTLSIPYRYPIDSQSIDNSYSTDRDRDSVKTQYRVQRLSDLSVFKEELSPRYPNLDWNHEIEKCWTYWEPKDKGSKKKPNWKLRLMNWLDNAAKRQPGERAPVVYTRPEDLGVNYG